MPKDNKKESSNDSFDVETNSINCNTYTFFDSNNSDIGYLSMDSLQNYVKYPMIYNTILREISRQAYNSNGIYQEAINSIVSIPLLPCVTVLRTPSKKKKDKNRKQKINLMLKLINHDKTTRDILMHLAIDGMYVGILRDTTMKNTDISPLSGFVESLDRIEGLSLDDNFMIQPLDLDYCKIVGYQNNIAIAAFDMQYFDQFKHGGLVNEIKNYPKEFITAYMDYKKDGSKRWYILDCKKTVALTARANIFEGYGRPYGISAFVDMKFNSDYSNSQYKLISELASSIYYLVLPEGEKEGRCSLNKVQQDKVIDAFKSAVKVNTSERQAKISTLSLPPNTKMDRLSKDSSLLKDTLNDENIKKISTDLGFASSALNAESNGGSSYSNLQVNLDLISAQVFKQTNEIAREYTRVLNEHENVKPSEYVDIKYLPISYINKNDMYDKMKELYTTMGGSRIYMIAAAGVDPLDYLSVCEEEINDKLDDKFPPHITSYTASDSADKSNPDNDLGGRPKMDSKDLSVGGQVQRNLKTNENIKPSTK